MLFIDISLFIIDSALINASVVEYFDIQIAMGNEAYCNQNQNFGSRLKSTASNFGGKKDRS